MSHDDQQIPQARLWDIQAQLHRVADDLERPGGPGAQHASDVYDVLGALKVATGDMAMILQRATGLLTTASDQGLISRDLTANDRGCLHDLWAQAAHLAVLLEQAQTAVHDVGGYLVAQESQPPATTRTKRQRTPAASSPEEQERARRVARLRALRNEPYIKRLVDQAPPLTEEQRATLAVLLGTRRQKPPETS